MSLSSHQHQQAPMETHTCLYRFCIATGQQGGTLDQAVKTFAKWPRREQLDFLDNLRGSIEDPTAIQLSDPHNYHTFAAKAAPHYTVLRAS